jgi:hypothetical protein
MVMKKQLIGTIVGGIILFIWQFLSWSLLPIHQSEMRYTPNQDKIMEALNQNLTEDGGYFLPNVSPESTPEQQQAYMESAAGKPWATITYHKSMNTNMGMNMVRGLAVDLVAAWLLLWLLMKVSNLSMSTAVQASLAVGIMSYLTTSYLNSIWFEGDSIGHLIDAVVSWGLLGAWAGWWLNRK